MRALLLLVAVVGCTPQLEVKTAPRAAVTPEGRLAFSKHTLVRKLGTEPVANVAFVSFTVPSAPDAAQNLSDRLRRDATKEADEFLKDFREAAREGDFGVAPWSLDVSVDVPYLSADLLVVRRDISIYTGGAHPNHHTEATTWELRGEFVALRLEDAFQPGAAHRLDPLVVAALQRQEAGWVTDGSLKSVADLLHTWYPRVNGLHFVFDPYEAGPYAEGSHEVVLGWKAVEAELAGPLSRFRPG